MRLVKRLFDLWNQNWSIQTQAPVIDVFFLWLCRRLCRWVEMRTRTTESTPSPAQPLCHLARIHLSHHPALTAKGAESHPPVRGTTLQLYARAWIACWQCFDQVLSLFIFLLLKTKEILSRMYKLLFFYIQWKRLVTTALKFREHHKSLLKPYNKFN